MTEAVAEAVAQLESEIANLRSLITDLRPAALDELGVQAAIEDLAEQARSHGLQVDLSVDLAYEQGRAPARQTSELETALYRITQEAITNAQKHGRRRRASVNIEEDENTVRVTIRDDGCGFDTTAHTSGFGLLGMQERAHLLDGALEIQSTLGHGSAVTANSRSGAAAAPRPPRLSNWYWARPDSISAPLWLLTEDLRS